MTAKVSETGAAEVVQEVPVDDIENQEWTSACLLDARQPIECRITCLGQLAAEALILP